MDPSHQDLWNRLDALQLDDPDSPLPFSARLARDNGWSCGYALRVVDQYKRFVFLVATGESPVCPSEEVDEAWHLHLCYTRCYWNTMCRDILGRPLHHEPTRGGGEQLAHHRQMYVNTLQAYRRAFGSEPPADVWPPVDQRFAPKGPQRRVDVAQHWIVRKPSFEKTVRRLSGRLHHVAMGAGAASISMLALANPLDMTGPQFLLFYGILLAVAALGGIVLRRELWKDDDGVPLPEVDAYEVAFVAGGAGLANRVAVSELAASGAIKIKDGSSPTLVAAREEPRASHPLVRGIYRAIAAEDQSGANHKTAYAGGKAAISQMKSRLQELNLIDYGWPERAYRWAPALMMAVILGLGIAKISVGLDRDKPVGILAVMCVVAGVGTLWFLKRSRRTARGQRLIDAMQSERSDLRTPAEWGTRPESDFVLGLGLFGLAGLATAGNEGNELHRWLFPKHSASTGCSTGTATGCGGSGCGGSGCGGGGGCGGGCGGCGGGS